MASKHPSRTLRAFLSATVVLGVLLSGGIATKGSGVAYAQSQSDEEEKGKEYWQERYRSLLRRAAEARQDRATAIENYTRAQRRNYPRGAARQAFLSQAEEAERELAEVEKELEKLHTDARRQGALPGWLYEVEDEPIELSPAAAAPPGEAAEELVDREGRNPLYFQDDEADGDR